MPDWRTEYLASFREQEKNNPVNLEIVQLCTSPLNALPAFPR